MSKIAGPAARSPRDLGDVRIAWEVEKTLFSGRIEIQGGAKILFFGKFRFRMIFEARMIRAADASTSRKTLMIFGFWHRRFWAQRVPSYTIWRKSVILRESKNEGRVEKLKMLQGPDGGHILTLLQFSEAESFATGLKIRSNTLEDEGSYWCDDPLIPAFSPGRRRMCSSVLAMANVGFAERGGLEAASNVKMCPPDGQDMNEVECGWMGWRTGMGVSVFLNCPAHDNKQPVGKFFFP